MLRQHRALGAHDGCPLHDIAKLAYVAGPFVLAKDFERRQRERGWASPFEIPTRGGKERCGECFVFPGDTVFSLRGVGGAGPNDVWAVGDNGTIVHWDGQVWLTFPSGTKQRLLAVWGSGAHDVWAVGYDSTILHLSRDSSRTCAGPTVRSIRR